MALVPRPETLGPRPQAQSACLIIDRRPFSRPQPPKPEIPTPGPGGHEQGRHGDDPNACRGRGRLDDQVQGGLHSTRGGSVSRGQGVPRASGKPVLSGPYVLHGLRFEGRTVYAVGFEGLCLVGVCAIPVSCACRSSGCRSGIWGSRAEGVGAQMWIWFFFLAGYWEMSIATKMSGVLGVACCPCVSPLASDVHRLPSFLLSSFCSCACRPFLDGNGCNFLTPVPPPLRLRRTPPPHTPLALHIHDARIHTPQHNSPKPFPISIRITSQQHPFIPPRFLCCTPRCRCAHARTISLIVYAVG
jgi:hypothetical protein